MTSTAPRPTAVGNLDRTPLCHLLLFCRDRSLTGTLCLWEPDAEPGGLGSAQLFVERGVVLAACIQASPDTDLASALVPTCCRKRGVFAFHEGRRLLGEHGQVVSGHVLPEALLALSLRAQYRNDVVNATLSPLADARLQVKAGVELSAFSFTPEELSLVQFLATHPSTIKELIGRGRPAPTTIRRLLYALRITRTLAVLPAGQPQYSGTVAVPQTPDLIHSRVPMPRTPTPAGGRRHPVSMQAPRADLTSQPAAAAQPTEKSRSQQTIVAHQAPEAVAAHSRPAPAKAPVRVAQHRGQRPPAGLPAGLTRRWQQIVARRASIAHESYFEMLGLRRDASIEDVHEAFTACESLWHPASLPPALKSLREDVTAIHAHLREAHATLSHPARRNEYVSVLEANQVKRPSRSSTPPRSQSKSIPPRDDERAEAAARAHHAGVQHLKRREFAVAVDLLQRAVTLAPQEAEFGATLAFARYELSGRREGATGEAIGMLESALADDPSCERAHHYIGVVLKQAGDIRLAMHHFEMAASLAPNNIEAARELRLHAMRARESDRGGLFGKLLSSIAPPRKVG